MNRSRKPDTPAPAAPPARVPAGLVALIALLAAVLAGLGVSFKMDDPDLWQHLAVGRVIWEQHRVPTENLWTWPSYGEPYLLPSWLFRALLWPLWQAGGEWGLMAWRWILTLGTFGLGWVVARRLGAKGLAPVVALLWCAIASRQRSMVRPEMLAALFMVVQVWVLERRRAGDHRIGWALVPLAWVWINAHISYTLFFEIGIAYLADAWFRRREGGPGPGPLAAALALSLAACFANPFGAAALWQPFDYLINQSREPIYIAIDELRPIVWKDNLRSGLPLLMAAIPALALLRWRRRLDVAQLLIYLAFIPQALGAVRFLGPLMAVAAPFFARDLAEWVASLRARAWTRPPLARAALATAACLMVAVPDLLRPNTTLGLGFLDQAYPASACDWIERAGVRGRSFSAFHKGGYLLWRFWPQRDRLPFMDIHQTGTRRDRDLMAVLVGRPEAWTELAGRHRFDWVLLSRHQEPIDRTLERIDADTLYARVFLDDDWVVYLRREGPMARLADSLAYRWLPASYRGMAALGDTVMANPAMRQELRAELDRSRRDSPRSGHAHSVLANLEILEGRWAEALEHLRAARAIAPRTPGLAERERQAADSLAAARSGAR